MQPLAVPEILAPAGNKPAFLAALAAGADAVYCGLKKFSARMEAANFTIEELSGLTALAHEQKTRVYVAFNSLIRSDEIAQTASLVQSLVRNVGPDAMIVQDLALISLARQLGFSGEIHLSTLANAGFAAALHPIRRNLDIQRVVIPRELNIDEIKTLAGSCPPGLDLEVFVHGALCYGISGRCYWSSYLGGKSGLRGRCVQPCRRHYEQGGRIRRFFSCQDLSLDTLVKTLLPIPQIRAWKIEGRKKGPHYVYYTVKAYQMLRDHGDDSRMKKSAMDLLAQALGRPSTHYRFLPQRPWNPVDTDRQTGSGLL
ncbi:MAG: U32 family peptidase, partial [Desulfobacterales bacterium]|nr:U32 family peptidase [Desulfobacterales bacterium]